MTLDDLLSAIADDVDDTTGEYGDQILKAVKAAQRWCERSTYYFNETRDVTFVTVDGQEWYGESDNSNIPTLVTIQEAWKEDAQGQRTRLTRVPPEEIEAVSDSAASSGEPYSWTYFGQRIRLYPIPDATVFTIRLQIGPYRLAPLMDGTDESAWLDEAFDMMKARAKYILYKDTLKDGDGAAEALNDYQDQHDALLNETARRNGTGRIVPTCF